jgi:dTDP-4-dehydrorhamnose reductase
VLLINLCKYSLVLVDEFTARSYLMTKVLVTGMSGLIGGLLRAHLEKQDGYQLTALNRREIEGVNSFTADISNLDSINPLIPVTNTLVIK